MRSRDDPDNPDVVTPLPFTLYPSPFPAQCFQHAVNITQTFNKLMHKVANDYEFLRSCLQQ